MNREHMVNMRKDGLPYEEMGYSGPPPNRCLFAHAISDLKEPLWSNLMQSEISNNFFSGQMDDVRLLS